jgi:hypothetical protein
MAKLFVFVVALIAVSVSLALSAPAPDGKGWQQMNSFPHLKRVASAP